MRIFRNDESYRQEKYESVEEYYTEARRGFKEKADHNKSESQSIFYLIITCTLLAPLFVTLGSGWFWGKVVPASLSVLAAGGSAWLQLRRPQRLWALYRRAQRELEREWVAYNFNIGEYNTPADKAKTFAIRIREICFKTHEQWEGIVPDPPEIMNSRAPSLPNEIKGNDDTQKS